MIVSTRDIVTSPPPPTIADLQRIAGGDQQACQELIGSWETPVKMIASRYGSRLSDMDDLKQVARLAVYHSALNYDPSLEVPFGNYTKRAIKNSVMQEAARLTRQRRLETSLDKYPEGDGYSPEVTVDKAQPVKEWILELPEPHATIFRLLYVEKVKQRAAAEEMGVSQPRVAQLHQSFLKLAMAVLAA